MSQSNPRSSEPVPLGPLPEQLYKYRSMASVALERTFTENEVWFSSGADFNDPYDCKVRCIVYDRSEADYARWIEDVIARRMPDMPAEARRKKAIQAAADPQRSQFMNRYLQSQVDGIGVFSVSADARHPLLWSHYAYCHTGICLEFKREGLFLAENLTEAFYPIYYQSKFPLVSEAADHFEQVKSIVLTKSYDWVYESEGRFLDWESGPGYRSFRPENLTTVIFGCRTKAEDKKKVRAWVSSGRTAPRFCEAVIRDGEYALDIRPSD